jgi:limonene-1,2-epoxide hydrolase
VGGPGEIVTAFIAAVEAKDLDTALGLVTEDVSYENVPIAPIVGKPAMRATLDTFLKSATRVEWRTLRQVVSGHVVINERLDRFQIGEGWLELPIAGFFEVTDEGLISVWRDYFDMSTYARQFAALTKPTVT